MEDDVALTCGAGLAATAGGKEARRGDAAYWASACLARLRERRRGESGSGQLGLWERKRWAMQKPGRAGLDPREGKE